MKILQDFKASIYYVEENKTVYIIPPVSVYAFREIKKALKYYNIEVKNIVVGRLYENVG